ncbi:endonuclease/exonuclease/phosphatase family protein [Dactylosporangium sp. CA-233914]|uniref:endonuclease/exonuclease/phosphatase family protein n=1 Tax=Dactylosporangium sp. CA-233914 TaxID=3239934 RepID=UPI003D92BA9C
MGIALAGLLIFHGLVPNRVGHLGSLVEALLPWFGLGVLMLFEVAVWRRTVRAFVSFLLPAVAWLGVCGGQLLPADDGPADLTVVQHNVSDENRAPAATARAIMEPGPDLIGLEELTPEALPVYEAVLTSDYPYHAVFGTVGLWSRRPIDRAEPVDIKPRGLDADWRRGLRAVVGPVVVVVAHLPSVRIGLGKGFDTGRRDDSAARLGAVVAGEERVVLIGDLNGTVEDRGLRPITRRLTTARSSPAWSFPARMPIGRIDHVMARGGTVTRVWTLPATGSDHLPVAARIRWSPAPR